MEEHRELITVQLKSDTNLSVKDPLAYYYYCDGSKSGIVRMESDSYQELVNNPNVKIKEL